MSDNKKNEKIEIDEEKAYLELCQIIAEALQTEDINLLQIRVEQWKKKYPYNKFSKNLKAKIDYLLNQFYSEVIIQILKSIKTNNEKKEFNQRKALTKLYKIIKETNDIKDLNKKVDNWKKEFPVDDFMDMYKKRVKKFTSKKYLEENAFDTDKAYYELYYTLKTNATYDELKDKVSIWEKNYNIGDKYSTDDFKKHTSDVKKFLDDEYIYFLAKEDEKEDTLSQKETTVAIQTASYAKLMEVLEKGNLGKTVEWIYRNRNIKFGNYYKEKIISNIAFKYPFSTLSNNNLKLNLNERGLSFYEYQNINESRKYLITAFLFNLMHDTTLNEQTFQTAFNKSEYAKIGQKSNDIEKENKKIEKEVSTEIKDDEVKIVTEQKEEQHEFNMNTNTEQVKEEQIETEKEESPTLVIDFKEEVKTNIKSNDKKDNILHVIELEGKEYQSKRNEKEKSKETDSKVDIKNQQETDTYIILAPDFIKVIYEKSKAAEVMEADILQSGKNYNMEIEKEGIDNISIADVDRIAAEAVNEEVVKEESFLSIGSIEN